MPTQRFIIKEAQFLEIYRRESAVPNTDTLKIKSPSAFFFSIGGIVCAGDSSPVRKLSDIEVQSQW